MSNNYNQYPNQRASNEAVRETPATTTEIVDGATDPEIIETETSSKLKEGIVTDCIKLNVRETPDTNAEILCEIQKDSEVMVDKSESTDEFYKVYTNSSIEGFCMKKYIALKD